MPDEIDRQTILDDEHLKLLSLGYIVSGGFTALFSLFALLYVFMGAVMTLALSSVPANPARANELPPAFVGYLLGGIGLGLFIAMIVVATLKFLTARNIRRRKSRIFCMAIAGLSCLEFPYGTFLGVLTFIVLLRDSVVRCFEAKV